MIQLAGYINRNFDLRKSVMNISTKISRWWKQPGVLGKCKIYRLRGAIIGTYENDQMYDRLVKL